MGWALSLVLIANSMLLGLLMYNLRNNEVKRTPGTVLNKGCPRPEQLSGRGLDPAPEADVAWQQFQEEE